MGIIRPAGGRGSFQPSGGLAPSGRSTPPVWPAPDRRYRSTAYSSNESSPPPMGRLIFNSVSEQIAPTAATLGCNNNKLAGQDAEWLLAGRARKKRRGLRDGTPEHAPGETPGDSGNLAGDSGGDPGAPHAGGCRLDPPRRLAARRLQERPIPVDGAVASKTPSAGAAHHLALISCMQANQFATLELAGKAHNISSQRLLGWTTARAFMFSQNAQELR